jgi:hypothetical protein
LGWLAVDSVRARCLIIPSSCFYVGATFCFVPADYGGETVALSASHLGWRMFIEHGPTAAAVCLVKTARAGETITGDGPGTDGADVVTM